MMNQVGIKKTNLDNLYQEVEELLDLIDYKPERDKILLKPNIVVAASPEEGDITHPKIIAALTHFFRKRNREVVVAEGTGIFGSDREFEKLLRATRYDYIRDELGVPIINLEQTETEKVPWAYGSIPLPKILKEYEYINVPTMKTHLQAFVTLGVKNQKGLIPMKTKKLFHKKDLHACIYELGKAVQPSLTVMDAIYCIEGTGPTGPPIGETKQMDLLIAGKDMMAVDNVCVEVMGFDIQEVKHLRPVKDIEILGENLQDVKSDFKKPLGFFSREHLMVHMDEKACTMCTVSFYKALSKILYTPELKEQLLNRKDLENIDIVLGPTDPTSELGDCALCVGDCSAKVAKKKDLPMIKGCHPDYRQIVNHLFPEYYPELNNSATKTPRHED